MNHPSLVSCVILQWREISKGTLRLCRTPDGSPLFGMWGAYCQHLALGFGSLYPLLWKGTIHTNPRHYSFQRTDDFGALLETKLLHPVLGFAAAMDSGTSTDDFPKLEPLDHTCVFYDRSSGFSLLMAWAYVSLQCTIVFQMCSWWAECAVCRAVRVFAWRSPLSELVCLAQLVAYGVDGVFLTSILCAASFDQFANIWIVVLYTLRSSYSITKCQ